MCCHISCPSNMEFARLDPGLWEMANCLNNWCNLISIVYWALNIFYFIYLFTSLVIMTGDPTGLFLHSQAPLKYAYIYIIYNTFYQEDCMVNKQHGWLLTHTVLNVCGTLMFYISSVTWHDNNSVFRYILNWPVATSASQIYGGEELKIL